jgi:Putative Ig domain
VAAKTTVDDGVPMSPVRRFFLLAYLITTGLLLVYGLIALQRLDFPETALVVESPAGSRVQAPAPPAVAPPPAAAQPPDGAKPPAAGAKPAQPGAGAAPPAGKPVPPMPAAPSVQRPVLSDVFAHVRSGSPPSHELALYGSQFDKQATVRLNGRIRAPEEEPGPDLIRVVPEAGDLAPGLMVVEVVNPGSLPSNALTLKTGRPKEALYLFGTPSLISRELQLILMVLFAGALGSYVHAIKSLADFIGNQTAISSWTSWYITRPFLGGTMAFIFYAVLRGGFLTGAPADVNFVNPFGAIAVAALVGMFADKAAQKLAEVFDTFLKAEDKRSGKLGAPVITKLEPPTVRTGVAPVEVKIIGDRLANVRTVKVDGKERTPEKIADKELVFRLQADDVKNKGTVSISAVTSEATSPSATLHVSDLDLMTTKLPDAEVGEKYTEVLSATGGTEPRKWSMAGELAGLKLNATSGALEGTPVKEEQATATFTVTDKAGASASRELTLRVGPKS